MRKKYMVLLNVAATICMLNSSALAHNKVVVVSLGGTAGNAVASDVVEGKTFSSNAAGKGATGTLELPPTAQGYTNSNNMTFNLIPAGFFTMGSPNDEPGAPHPDEQSQHQVNLSKSFYMQTTEVTQKQWEDVMKFNPARSKTGAEYPIENVNWFEAAYFANELSTLELPALIPCYDLSLCSGAFGATYTCSEVGITPNCTGYRLPTEAEWEYAARATTTTAWAYLESYDFSADPGQVTGIGFNSNLDAMGWYAFNNTTQYAEGTKPVAKKQPNKWGLYDMHGNVWEWCQDWYDRYYYRDPTSGTDPQGPDVGTRRVNRGGYCYEDARYARSANRHNSSPDYRNNYLGFRLILPSGQ